MRRIFDRYAYGAGPRSGCWWDETCDVPRGRCLTQDTVADVAIIGGGYTGISAALRLANAGVSVVLLEAENLGWGASGRNGGFCCLGGGIATDAALDKQYGKPQRLSFRSAEKSAVDHVDRMISELKIGVDRHSLGETELAHRPKDMTGLRRSVDTIVENYGVEPKIIEKGDLPDQGFGGGPFFGGRTIPIGFGLNPRKYLSGLVAAAQDAGAALFEGASVRKIALEGGKHVLHIGDFRVRADHVILATNGYSAENLPDWLAGRYLPAQSTVLVTRPLTEVELQAQGWTTEQMSFDTRRLLHYFRLMPDRRFLFGMRGALLTGVNAEETARRRLRLDFEKMFPAWAQVPSNNSWSGFVSLARDKLPFIGQIPGLPSVWTAMCYHGNGVAMGSFAGTRIAELVLGLDVSDCPDILRNPLRRFPFGVYRRAVMPPLYAKLMLEDYF